MSYIENICGKPEFLPFRWWSKWCDVCVFDYDYKAHLLQARRSRNGKCQFRIESAEKKIAACYAKVIDIKQAP